MTDNKTNQSPNTSNTSNGKTNGNASAEDILTSKFASIVAVSNASPTSNPTQSVVDEKEKEGK